MTVLLNSFLGLAVLARAQSASDFQIVVTSPVEGAIYFQDNITLVFTVESHNYFVQDAQFTYNLNQGNSGQVHYNYYSPQINVTLHNLMSGEHTLEISGEGVGSGSPVNFWGPTPFDVVFNPVTVTFFVNLESTTPTTQITQSARPTNSPTLTTQIPSSTYSSIWTGILAITIGVILLFTVLIHVYRKSKFIS
jgi:hypothetical protein